MLTRISGPAQLEQSFLNLGYRWITADTEMAPEGCSAQARSSQLWSLGFPCVHMASHLPGSFGCNALILIHSGQIDICDANFSGDLDSELEQDVEDNSQLVGRQKINCIS